MINQCFNTSIICLRLQWHFPDQADIVTRMELDIKNVQIVVTLCGDNVIIVVLLWLSTLTQINVPKCPVQSQALTCWTFHSSGAMCWDLVALLTASHVNTKCLPNSRISHLNSSKTIIFLFYFIFITTKQLKFPNKGFLLMRVI